MNKSLRYVNLNLKLHVVSTSLLESDTSETFSLYFTQAPLKPERSALKMYTIWCRTDVYSLKLSAKAFLMLDNPFPVPFRCKLKHSSLYLIQNSMKITCE